MANNEPMGRVLARAQKIAEILSNVMSKVNANLSVCQEVRDPKKMAAPVLLGGSGSRNSANKSAPKISYVDLTVFVA